MPKGNINVLKTPIITHPIGQELDPYVSNINGKTAPARTIPSPPPDPNNSAIAKVFFRVS